MVWVETPSNPLLNIVDIRAAAEAAHSAGALLVVDNTFATPYLQQPLELGADVVVHSTTKYLGGHSDVVGGFAATNDPTVAERLRFLQKSLGAVPGPFDSWLVLRGIKTLAVRMRQHCENAIGVAALLERNARVERVFYPGLPTHPGHEIAARQMRDFGGMVSFLAESPEEAAAIAGRTKLFQLAESLGGVESLIEVPARMTHASTADAPFAAPPNLVRLSVGIESAEDLLDDLERRAPCRLPQHGTQRVRRRAKMRRPSSSSRSRRARATSTSGTRSSAASSSTAGSSPRWRIPPTTASSRGRSPRTATRSTRSCSSPTRPSPAAGFACAPIGVFHMADEKGPDEKLLCVPLGDPAFERISDIHDVANELRDEIEHFFQRYKDLEPSKRTETRGWGNRDEAEKILVAAREREAG